MKQARISLSERSSSKSLVNKRWFIDTHYSLVLPGLPREVSREHSAMIMEQFTRIASMIQFLILIYDLPLPISIVKHNNILWFQFLNDFSK